jgi:hypothetical protein
MLVLSVRLSLLKLNGEAVALESNKTPLRSWMNLRKIFNL